MLRVSLVDEDLRLAAETEPERLDPSVFGLLYEKHRLSVYRYLRARTRSDEDALDLAAVTFERAFGSLGGFRRRDGGVQAWLLRIARNMPRSTASPSRPIASSTSGSRSSISSPGCHTIRGTPCSSDTPAD